MLVQNKKKYIGVQTIPNRRPLFSKVYFIYFKNIVNKIFFTKISPPKIMKEETPFVVVIHTDHL